MRIVGGQFKGRRITAARGDISRPTTDRNREALFNILSTRIDMDGARVIDLFAGSGALGLEAVSRGASFCLFVETNASARGAIRDNIEALSLFGHTRIHRRSAISLGARPASAGAPFSLAFMDPPYRQTLAEPALAGLRDGAWLAPEATVIVEQAKDEPAAACAGFEEVDRRLYGDTAFGLFRSIS